MISLYDLPNVFFSAHAWCAHLAGPLRHRRQDVLGDVGHSGGIDFEPAELETVRTEIARHVSLPAFSHRPQINRSSPYFADVTACFQPYHPASVSHKREPQHASVVGRLLATGNGRH
jgi:hypothetical protein